MISKPLFKQSCKANAGIWGFVTAITCFMLAIIIFVLGNLNVNEIRGSMTDMFVSDSIEATINKQSLTFYNMADNALVNFNETSANLKQVADGYKQYRAAMAGSGASDQVADSYAREQLTNGKDDNTKASINAFLDFCLTDETTNTKNIGDYSFDSNVKAQKFTLNQIANSVYNQVLAENDEETAEYAKSFITTAIDEYIEEGATDVTEFTTSYIPTVLQDLMYPQEFNYRDETLKVSTYFSKEEIGTTSRTAIVKYRAQIADKEKQIRAENPTYTDEQVKAEVSAYSSTLVADMSKDLLQELPTKVADALSELGDLDVYGLVIGSIFFRIAGLLLPMIFVIMTANNLIAGQVDSGSMAYVLSTPTKRKTVVFTQMCYLVCSLFAMFALTTITSVVCLAIVNSAEITITYGEILLLNLGAFITMFAISGICFLASSWFNRSKISMSCGGGLTMFFLVATILGLFGSKVIPSAIRIDAMKVFNYVSIISLFDAISILEGTLTFLWKFAILLVIGIVCYAVSFAKFDKKDLPL